MRVLFLTPWYPEADHIYRGVFVREHAKAVRAAGNYFQTFLDGNGDIQGKIQSNGANGVTYATNGIDLAERLRERVPSLRVIMTSGYLDDKSREGLIKNKGFGFLPKPYALGALLEAVKQALAS